MRPSRGSGHLRSLLAACALLAPCVLAVTGCGADGGSAAHQAGTPTALPALPTARSLERHALIERRYLLGHETSVRSSWVTLFDHGVPIVQIPARGVVFGAQPATSNAATGMYSSGPGPIAFRIPGRGWMTGSGSFIEMDAPNGRGSIVMLNDAGQPFENVPIDGTSFDPSQLSMGERAFWGPATLRFFTPSGVEVKWGGSNYLVSRVRPVLPNPPLMTYNDRRGSISVDAAQFGA